MRTITLKYDATCRDCGAALKAGARAKYYGRGKVYGVNCHDKPDSYPSHWPAGPGIRPRHFDNEGHTRSHYDPTGFYSADGTLLGRTNSNGRCEDAPCCGCCT